MPVVTMPGMEANSRRILCATLRELCRSLSSFQMSEQECEALAVAAVGGHPEAEFMVGSVFDAADEPDDATKWYFRSASRDYLPAMLQLLADR